MNECLQRQLKAQHSVLLKALGDRRYRQPIGHYGIECGDGWYKLIDDLCTKIETAMLAAPLTYVRVHQVKQKLGYLEFYVGLEEDTPTVEQLIQRSRERSATTCERCGEHGRRRTDGWLMVLCDTHHQHRSWMKHA